MKLIALGPAGTFSHLAALKVSPLAEVTFVSSLREGFDLLKNRKHDGLIAPVENILHGTVRETLDHLYASRFKIGGAVNLPIRHSLLAKNANEIKKIFSHSQALNQCQKFLARKYPAAELIPCNSTAQACKWAEKTKFAAAIAHESCRQWYPKLQTAAKNIHDDNKNSTKFLLIGDDYSLLNEKFTAIAIEPKADAKGVLLAILKICKSVNLSKIESRPNRDSLGNYIFFIDFSGDFREAKIQKMLTKLTRSPVVKKLRVFGGYSV